jgi:hypothetical protein
MRMGFSVIAISTIISVLMRLAASCLLMMMNSTGV